MESIPNSILSLQMVGLVVTLLLLSLSHIHVAADHESQKTYIVHMDKSLKPMVFTDHNNWYDTSLRSVSDSADMLYTYDIAVHGFATRLTEMEAQLLRNSAGVLSVTPEMRYELATTRTSDFLGLTWKINQARFPSPSKVSDIVIGVLDTGVWPEIGSYSDAGLGPVPRGWRGKCESGQNFSASSCNRKLIGARAFWKGYERAKGRAPPTDDEALEYKSPRDEGGHGTHTSTTAAGSPVASASFSGFARGTARGTAPTARIATYKVCWLLGCFDSDIIAAVDSAIKDGVHILSLSLGGGLPEYHSDNIAKATFSATAHGILVSASAGNSGPHWGTVFNVAPWITTVGAGTIDRDFPAYVKLGNGKTYKGVAVHTGKPLSAKKFVPIINGLSASVNNSLDASLCLPGTLDRKKAAGKILLCYHGRVQRTQTGLSVKDAGGVGMVLTTDEDSSVEEIIAEAHLLPATYVSLATRMEILNYLESAGANATATIIQGGTKLGVQPSPRVASFSSRGPNQRTHDILKPDIIAPGTNVLAGWTGAVGPSGLRRDKRRVSFALASGTSMSCPHVSGIAALLRAARPKWSPAAIRSAMMTTAYSTYRNGKTLVDVATGVAATPFGFGAGHVDPTAALNPGLVYDAHVQDYINFLCALDYAPEQIKTVTKRAFTCSNSTKYSVGDLNYPSFAVRFAARSDEEVGPPKNDTQTVRHRRTLTNVGLPGTYKVSVTKVDSVKIVVKPISLTFKKAYEKKSFTVTFIGRTMPSETEEFARLEWSDGKHFVRSPIAFVWLNLE